MLELALGLFLTAAPGDYTLASEATAPNATVTSIASSKVVTSKQGSSEGKGGERGNSGGQGGERGKGNRPAPGPLPLVLLALGACGVAGAVVGARRRRRQVAAEVAGAH